MGQRNFMCMSQMSDLESGQESQSLPNLEPGAFLGSITNYPQPNIHPILPPPGNAPNLDAHHIPEHHDSSLFYGMPQYNCLQHQHQHPVANIDLAAFTYYNPYMAPPAGSRVLPVSMNHGSHGHLISSSNNGVIGASVDGHGRGNYFVDGAVGSFKRKNTEGFYGNFNNCNTLAGASSSITPMNVRPHESDITLMDDTSFVHPEYRGNDMSSTMDAGSHRHMRNICGAVGLDSELGHSTHHVIQGNYVGQPFHASGIPWFDQQFSNGVDGRPLTWNHVPALPYAAGSISGSSVEAGSMCVQGYHVVPNTRSSTSFLHPPLIHQGRPNLHLPAPPHIQGVRGLNIDFHSQVGTSTRRLSTSSPSHANGNPFQDGRESGPGVLGSFPQTGLRIYRPHRRGVVLDANPRQRNLPNLRVLPEDGVAILEISGYREAGDLIDHHQDMRLDIDHMSYEELLALGEQIGSVGTGISEGKVLSHLKTRRFVSTYSDLDAAACWNQDTDFCVICQADYKDQEKIGNLDCGHEYHADCITKWLVVKNSCPICKCPALTTDRKDL